MAFTKKDRRFRIKKRIRKQINGTADKPRMAVFRSNRHIYVQLIDDEQGKTLCSYSTRKKEVADQSEGLDKSEQAKLVGKYLAQKSIEKGINKVVFDRSGYRYHGRVRKLAEEARKEGLKF
ncbi:MAG: 50S ribosomal protein L18 [Bacteroidales bacterium]|nr:50S ribosomal protein L18 [Bacteroidales bacterium]